jgi:HAD superfamily hydrolase (TIGR01509 family)
VSSVPAAVLWDMDGTLIDTEPYWIRCEHELVARYGGRWSDEDALSIIGFDLMDAAEVLRTRGGVPLRPHDVVDQLSDAVAAMVRERIPWRPGGRELLAALKLRGVPCALVTMSWKRLVDEVVRQLPPHSFQAVITGDMVMNGKPHPEPYRRAAEELGVDPLACVAIEDSPIGVASAEGAGCVVVAVRNLLPIPEAPHRVVLSTLQGVTPELLGEYIEQTPPPDVRPEPTPPRAAPTERASRHVAKAGAGGSRLPDRWSALAALAAVVLLLVAGGIWWFAIRDTQPSHDPGPFRVHAWVPPWNIENALDELEPRADMFHQISPFWYEVTGVSTIQPYANTPEEETDEFVRKARSRGIPLVGSLYDRTAPNVMAALLADPESRAAHIDAIVRFAADNDFQGIDINYENFAFNDGRDTWATTRPVWVTFIEELGARLHADGRLLTVSVPPVYDDEQTDDSGFWVYDFGAIAPHVDAIRVMAYDYSVSEPGPIAPLEWVEELIAGSAEAAGGPEKLVLGIPLYGRNWVIATSGDCPDDTPGRQEPRLNAIEDLIERRDAEPIFNDETGEWSFTYQVGFPEDDPQCTQTREVHYLDADGAQQRMQLSVDNGWLGVSLFAFSYEDDALWDRIAEINATLETVPDESVAPTTIAPTTAAPTTAAATSATSTSAATTTAAATTTTTG